MRLTEADLKFLVETVAPGERDSQDMIRQVRGEPALLQPMLEDRRVIDRLLGEEENLARASLYLLFSVLVRRIWRDLEKRAFVLERDLRGKVIPVFEAPKVAELLGEAVIREYLVELLCSFVRTNTAVLYFKERGAWRKRKFSDLDLDDMIALCQVVEPGWKPRLHKRIADIALFLTGIYPDRAIHSMSSNQRRFSSERNLPEYEREGRRFYSIAAREPEPPWPASVFASLAEKFSLAREALNALSDCYLKPLRERYFDAPPG